MSALIPASRTGPPALPLPPLFTRSERSTKRFLEFFTATIRNKHTRRAYLQVVERFSTWCEGHNLAELHQVQPIHVAGYIEALQNEMARPSVKQHLAALRRLFDWLVTGQVIEHNPAHAVRGPAFSVKKGKTPVLQPEEARALLDAIDTSTLIGLRDRALVGLMAYSFARVGAATAMNVEDYYTQGRKGWVRLHEKGGKRHELPCHHKLDTYLEEYVRAAVIEGEKKGPMFRTVAGRSGRLTANRMQQAEVYLMIRRRAESAGIETQIGCHTFRATGITAYLKNGGKLEVAQHMANHESSRTTGLYDRRGDEVSLDEIERIRI